MVRTRLGLFREALSDFNQAVRQAPEFPLPYLHRGNAYGTLDDHQAALDDFSEAIRLKPDLAVAYYSRAVAWLHLGDNSRASEDCETAIRYDESLRRPTSCGPGCSTNWAWPTRPLPVTTTPSAWRPTLPPPMPAGPTPGSARAITIRRSPTIARPSTANRRPGRCSASLTRNMPSRRWFAGWPRRNRARQPLSGRFLARSHSLDEALDQCEAALGYLPAEEVLGVALGVLQQHRDDAGPEPFQRIEAWFQRAPARREGPLGSISSWPTSASWRAALRSYARSSKG